MFDLTEIIKLYEEKYFKDRNQEVITLLDLLNQIINTYP